MFKVEITIEIVFKRKKVFKGYKIKEPRKSSLVLLESFYVIFDEKFSI
jgi:hypothetical protein